MAERAVSKSAPAARPAPPLKARTRSIAKMVRTRGGMTNIMMRPRPPIHSPRKKSIESMWTASTPVT
jgi:hypothetical protein